MEESRQAVFSSRSFGATALTQEGNDSGISTFDPGHVTGHGSKHDGLTGSRNIMSKNASVVVSEENMADSKSVHKREGVSSFGAWPADQSGNPISSEICPISPREKNLTLDKTVKHVSTSDSNHVNISDCSSTCVLLHDTRNTLLDVLKFDLTDLASTDLASTDLASTNLDSTNLDTTRCHDATNHEYLSPADTAGSCSSYHDTVGTSTLKRALYQHSVSTCSPDSQLSASTFMNYSMRRYSDSHILVHPSIRAQQLDTCLHLLTGSSQEIAQTCERVILKPTDNESPVTQAFNLASFKNNLEVQSTTITREQKAQSRIPERIGLYARPMPQKCAVFEKAPTKWFSSTPDIRIDHNFVYHSHLTAGFDHGDSSTDLSQPVIQLQSDSSKNTSSKILDIFRNTAPDSTHRSKRRQGFRLTRKHSMDSQMISNQRLPRPAATETKPSKRAIKISSPDKKSSLYLSGADSLGGLPDDADNKAAQHLRLLARLEFHPLLSRTSSCPVIFEGEELDTSSSPHAQPSSPDRESFVASFEQSAGTFSNSSVASSTEKDDADGQSSHKPGHCGMSRQFFVGSDPPEGSDDLENSRSSPLMAGVIFLAHKRSAARKQHKHDVASEEKRESAKSVHVESFSQPVTSLEQPVANMYIKPESCGRQCKRQHPSKIDTAITGTESKPDADESAPAASCKSRTSIEQQERIDSQSLGGSLAQTNSRQSSSSVSADSSNSLSGNSFLTSSADESSS